MNIQDMKIQRKIALVVTGVSVFILLVATLGNLFLERVNFQRQAENELAKLAAMVALGVNDAMLGFEPSPKEAARTLEILRAKSEISEAHIYSGAERTPFASTPQGAIPPRDILDWNLGDHQHGGGLWYVSDLVDERGRHFGKVALHSTLARLRDQQRVTLQWFGLMSVCTLGLAIVLSLRLSHGISRPLAQLASTMQEIETSGGHAIRVPTFGADEVGKLALGINRMLDSLAVQSASLLESRQRLEFALQGGALGIWDWFPQTGVATYSDLWIQMLEYRRDEVENDVDFFKRHVHPEDLPAVFERLSGHLEGREPVYQSEHRLRTKSGRWIWVLDRGRIAERDQAGRPRRVTGVIADITERKRAETEMRTLLRTAPVGIGTVKMERITDVNAALCELLGSTREELLNQNVRCFFATEKDAQQLLPGMLRRLRSGESISMETSARRKDGAIIELLLRISPLDPVNVLATGSVCVVLDITAQKQAMALQQAKSQAEAANRAKSAFLANMSHEIRTPMNAVLGFAQLLQRDPSLAPEAQSKVRTIMKSGEHLLGIINDILEVSRIEAGRVELHPESVDLSNLLGELADMFHPRAEEKGLSFTLDYAVEAPRHISADLGKLRQVLINLLGNALKFTRQGGIRLRVLPVAPNRIAIEVLDTGIGISPQEQEKLFRLFERTRGGEQVAGGTGLGLAISREYAHLMGGEITVTSSAGAGSCFRFEFPATATVGPISIQPVRRVVGLAPGETSTRVLVVDDDPINRNLLREILEPLGFVVHEAENGAEAIAQTKALRPRIVLMDLVMPGMDGIEASQILRRTYPKESLTIIGLSASAFMEEKQRFLDAGLDAFIAKPFREQDLFSLMSLHAGIVFATEAGPALTEPTPTNSVSFPPGRISPDVAPLLRAALEEADLDRVLSLIAELAAEQPELAQRLYDQAGRYEYAQLLAWLATAEAQ